LPAGLPGNGHGVAMAITPCISVGDSQPLYGAREVAPSNNTLPLQLINLFTRGVATPFVTIFLVLANPYLWKT